MIKGCFAKDDITAITMRAWGNDHGSYLSGDHFDIDSYSATFSGVSPKEIVSFFNVIGDGSHVPERTTVRVYFKSAPNHYLEVEIVDSAIADIAVEDDSFLQDEPDEQEVIINSDKSYTIRFDFKNAIRKNPDAKNCPTFKWKSSKSHAKLAGKDAGTTVDNDVMEPVVKRAWGGEFVQIQAPTV